MQTVLQIDDARLRMTLAIQRCRNGQRHGVAEVYNLRFFRMVRGYCVAKRRHKSIGQRHGSNRTCPAKQVRTFLLYRHKKVTV